MDENKEAAPVAKRGFSVWLDNFWYHYKWQTIIAIFAIVIVTVCTLQMCDKESYDSYILYAGDKEISRTGKDGDITTEYETFLASLSRIAPDRDGNGVKNVSLKDLFLLTSSQLEEAEKLEDKEVNYVLQNNNMEMFSTTITYSDYFLCFLSKELYEENKTIDGISVFENLTSSVSGSSAVLYDDFALLLSSTAFYSLPGICELPEDTVVCVRAVSPLASQFNGEKSQKHHDAAMEAFKNIVNYGN